MTEIHNRSCIDERCLYNYRLVESFKESDVKMNNVKWHKIALLSIVVFLILSTETLNAEPVFQDATAKLSLTLGDGHAAWCDYNNDGWVDLYAAGTLWQNDHGKTFKKIVTKGPGILGDFDNDGYADLYVYSNQQLFKNNQGKDFVEVAMPDLPKAASLGANFGDYNNDAFIDIYVGGYEVWDKQITYPDRLFLNNKGESFASTWSEPRYRSRGVTSCDFDKDGDLDVYVSNYRLQPNNLWLNDGSGQFKDVAKEYNTLATSPGFDGGHSIGAAWADLDNDGNIDLFAGNFAHRDKRGDQPKSRFLRNMGPKKKHAFDDKGTCGVFYQESYASTALGDYDNDGDLDLFFTAVYGTASFGVKNYPVLFRNDGNWVFTDVTEQEGLALLGPTYQAAWADFDNDGDLDLAANGKLFENKGNPNHWLKVNLRGDGKKINRNAIGAQVRIKTNSNTLTRQVEAGTGQGNQNEFTLHFGLNNHKDPVQLEIFWPNGTTQTITNVKTDRLIEIQFKNQ